MTARPTFSLSLCKSLIAASWLASSSIFSRSPFFSFSDKNVPNLSATALEIEDGSALGGGCNAAGADGCFLLFLPNENHDEEGAIFVKGGVVCVPPPPKCLCQSAAFPVFVCEAVASRGILSRSRGLPKQGRRRARGRAASSLFSLSLGSAASGRGAKEVKETKKEKNQINIELPVLRKQPTTSLGNLFALLRCHRPCGT